MTFGSKSTECSRAGPCPRAPRSILQTSGLRSRPKIIHSNTSAALRAGGLFDAGVWAPMGDAEKSLKTGSFKFRLAGEKLKGGWMLARLKHTEGEKPGWLLIKEHDMAADTETDILAARPESVKTGRHIEDLQSPKPGKRAVKLKPAALRAP